MRIYQNVSILLIRSQCLAGCLIEWCSIFGKHRRGERLTVWLCSLLSLSNSVTVCCVTHDRWATIGRSSNEPGTLVEWCTSLSRSATICRRQTNCVTNSNHQSNLINNNRNPLRCAESSFRSHRWRPM